MYVDCWSVNQKPSKSTIVDSDATHNFITEAEARWLNLHWEKDIGKMKVMNSTVLHIVGLVKRTIIKLGAWNDLIDVMVFKMDDFEVIPM